MILLWDSADMTVHITLVNEDDMRTNVEWQAERNLARDMLGYLKEMLAARDLDFASITGIGVFRGPGSYTGLRIGLTVLNTIASDRHIPIVGDIGESWLESCLEKLRDGVNEQMILPEYGGDAHITKPRK